MSRTQQRLPLEIHEQVFVFVLKIAEATNLLRGKTVAVDSTTLEANAAMKSIQRVCSGAAVRTLLEEGHKRRFSRLDGGVAR